MAKRLNISLPDDLYAAARTWRRRVNLSAICAEAIKQHIRATEESRQADDILSHLQRSPHPLESELADAWQLREAILQVVRPGEDLRQVLGSVAATYLLRRVCSDDSLLGLAGGRQMWCLVTHLEPRWLRTTITAVGIHQNDPQVLHVHPNTIVTLTWLLFAPYAKARLVGDVRDVWHADLPTQDHVHYYLFGSGGPFATPSAIADLFGERATRYLLRRGAVGDFLYVFFDREGRIVSLPSDLHRHCVPPARVLKALAHRQDVRVVLVAGGSEKLPTIRFALKARLCNALITDESTAQALVSDRED